MLYDILDWIKEQKVVIISVFLSVLILGGIGLHFNNVRKAEAEDLANRLAAQRAADEESIAEPEESHQEEVIKEITPPEEVEDRVASESGSVSILFLGIDSREHNLVGRSDSMVLLTANKKDNSVKLLSIPRDSYVKIAGKEFYDKITHAHAFGGSDMSVETVERLFGIEIDHVVSFNFYSFVDVVDIIGGIEVEVPFNFTESAHTGETVYFTKGIQHLNGTEALAYARMRKQDPKGDIGRGERQQQIIEAVIRKGTEFSTITKFKDLFDLINKQVKTDIGIFDVIELAPHIQSIGNIEKLNLTGGGKQINGVYYYQLNEFELNSVRQDIQNHLSSDY